MGDGVMGDAGKLGERNWRNGARNWDSWQKLLKKALAQKGAVVLMMMMIQIQLTYGMLGYHSGTVWCAAVALIERFLTFRRA